MDRRNNWKLKRLLHFMDARGVMDQMLALSIRYIEANYFQHNIEFSASDVTQAKIIFSCRRGFASMEGEPQKASAIGRRKFSRKKRKHKNVKAKEKGRNSFLCLLWENVCQSTWPRFSRSLAESSQICRLFRRSE